MNRLADVHKSVLLNTRVVFDHLRLQESLRLENILPFVLASAALFRSFDVAPQQIRQLLHGSLASQGDRLSGANSDLGNLLRRISGCSGRVGTKLFFGFDNKSHVSNTIRIVPDTRVSSRLFVAEVPDNQELLAWSRRIFIGLFYDFPIAQPIDSWFRRAFDLTAQLHSLTNAGSLPNKRNIDTNKA